MCHKRALLRHIGWSNGSFCTPRRVVLGCFGVVWDVTDDHGRSSSCDLLYSIVNCYSLRGVDSSALADTTSVVAR